MTSDKMPPTVYGPRYGKAQPEVHVTTSVLITDIQCRTCGEWIETWQLEGDVEKDADGWSVPPEHACTGKPDVPQESGDG